MTRSGCHLCDQAEPVVRDVARRLDVPMEVVDIHSDDELVRLYSLRIPVVLGPAGEVVAEGTIEERPLRKAMARFSPRARWRPSRWLRPTRSVGRNRQQD